MNDYHIRLAGISSQEDRTGLMDLWSICFDDTPEFTDFFFSKRYIPDNIVCAEYEGRIVAAMHSLPVSLLIRGTTIPSAIIAGVGTHPDFRGKGLMRRMFGFFMTELAVRGIWTVTYHPVDFAIYRSMGHLSTSDHFLFSRMPVSVKDLNCDPISMIIRDTDGFVTEAGHVRHISGTVFDDMHSIYTHVSLNYSGMVARNIEDFSLKLADYASSGARFLSVRNAVGTIEGYCIYFVNDDKLLAEEVIFRSERALVAMIGRINSKYKEIGINFKLPPDTDIRKLTDSFAGTTSTLIEQNASGTTDLGCFIKALNFSQIVPENLLKEFVVHIKDDFNSRNTGTFDLTGARRDIAPVISTDIGSFVRFLFGYISASDLADSSDENAGSLADRTDLALGRPVCRIIDEY